MTSPCITCASLTAPCVSHSDILAPFASCVSATAPLHACAPSIAPSLSCSQPTSLTLTRAPSASSQPCALTQYFPAPGPLFPTATYTLPAPARAPVQMSPASSLSFSISTALMNPMVKPPPSTASPAPGTKPSTHAISPAFDAKLSTIPLLPLAAVVIR